jgi:hypothetical protein
VDELTKFNPLCEEDRRKCACFQTAKAGTRLGKLVIDPKSGKHIILCALSVTICGLSWVSVMMPKVSPALAGASAPVTASCMWAEHIMEKYESTS